MDPWEALLDELDVTRSPLAPLPTPLAGENPLDALEGASVSTDLLFNANGFSGVNSQGLQAQIRYPGVVGLTSDSDTTCIPTLDLLDHGPDAIGSLFGPDGNIDEFINTPDTMVDVNPYSAGMSPPFHQCTVDAPGGWTSIGDGAAPDGININISSLRLRGGRSPPQTYEPNVWRLYDRLIYEGAEFDAAIVLRDVIFADGVTLKALMAPIPTREMFLAYSGASRMWQLLLETKQVVPGKQKYRCRLCPVENRPEWKHDRDSIRHFNKDHFGFSFPCKYW